MKRLWLILAMLAGLLAFSASDISPWDIWKNAYTLYEQGEQLREKGELRKALSAFEEAKGLYRQLQRDRPDWSQKILNTRIGDCDRAITELKRLVGDDEPAVPAKSSASSNVDFAEQQSLRRELKKYKDKLNDIIVENDSLRRQLAQNLASQKEVANLLREQRVMSEKYAALEKRYLNLERRAAEPNQQLNELRNQLIETKLSADQTDKRLKTANARIQKLEQDAVELQRVKSKAEADAKTLNNNATRLERELTELRRFQKDATDTRSKLQQLLDQANLKLKQQASQINTLANNRQQLDGAGPL